MLVLEEQVLRFVQQQLQKLLRLLASDYPECSEEEEEEESREVLNITLDFLKRMDQEHLAQRLRDRSKVGFRDKLKSDLQQRFSRVFEGVAKAGDSAPLTQIYTELVLTKGVAGVGKTVLTQKLSLDWAEGRAHQDLQLLFPFTFRDLNRCEGSPTPQKEQYFRKRFRDQATVVISHIKSVRSLHIMSHIPIFCWILSKVLQKLLEQTEPELPRTLTQMYVHFLVVQAKVQNIKYQQGSGEDLHWTPETREMVKSLGKVAFEQLQKGNLIFYESDLSECGLDAAAASVYSGVFTQVFREEPGLYQDKVYCFIHLSVQEFLAALHVHQTFYSSGENLLETPHSSESPKPEAFYRSAVDQALQSPNGHLDLFLRFLLGLSLPTNQRLLQGLLTHTGSDRTNQETVKFIKQKLDGEGLSAERSLNLLHCLNELNDQSLVQEIQKNMRRYLSEGTMSPAQWSALSFVLLSSDSDLEEFDLRKYQASENALLGLLPVVRASTKALLCGCGLSPRSCAPLASVLSSSSLTHLDLSHNDLQDSGVELLCSGLKSAPCSLETLRLSGCLVSERGGAALASALSSAPSHLREFDLSYNHPGPSAELLTALQDQRPLLSVRLDPAGERWMVPGLRKYSCDFALDPNSAHRSLLLSEDHRTVTRVRENQEYPDHEDRFTDWSQVLSCTGLRGRCYWEVDWSLEVYISVSYRGIKRKGRGPESEFGLNDQSWSLGTDDDGEYYIHHNGITTQLPRSCHSERGGVSSGRVGVFLDSEAGVLSFYHISSDGELVHIWTFSSSFSEPLFPGFALWDVGSSATLVKEMRQN
ncbi:NACHT, LRR and PYD domains-containing protein 1-like [Boleophthalmus pectinirostris]|uniref:NACHT, LRR and PYD domains-containing protein 1-like n=1 Tax=Boleophthalmus pectinirostris TaxID=150288 RepID=UPI0024329687|nr:NACHT, LRR and PYD domains-containing protein 1-like [Boleophthalmus pectinirostris]